MDLQKILLSICMFFFVLTGNCSANQSQIDNSSLLVIEDAMWVWAEPINNQFSILISQQNGAMWSEPEKISNNNGINVVPAVTKLPTEELMVVWSTFQGEQSQLHYKEFKDGIWTEEKEYYSGLSSNTAPTVGIDEDSKLWLVWAGFSGVSDEIYYTHWNGSSFETARAITSNNVPDILPVLGVDEDTQMVWIQWQQFTENGYVEFETTWNGTDWTEPVVVKSKNATETFQEATKNHNLLLKRSVTSSIKNTDLNNFTSQLVTKKQELIIEIPSFISYSDSASIHIPGYPVQSLPVRNMLWID